MSHRARLSDKLRLVEVGGRGEITQGAAAMCEGSIGDVLSFIAAEFPFATIGGVWLVNDDQRTIGRIIGARDRRRGIRTATGEPAELSDRGLLTRGSADDGPQRRRGRGRSGAHGNN